MRYLPPQTGDFEGHVSHPLRDGTGLGREALSGDAEAEGAAVMKFPPLKSVLPAHVEELTGVAQGMLKHFWRAHKKFVQWAPIGQGFSGGGDYVLLPSLKKMQKPIWPLCETPLPASLLLWCLLMTCAACV